MTAGTILAGKYRLISLLGRGGMGSVWRAERLGWQAPVAIKLMHLSGADDPQTLVRFQREARLAASLRSIHVVQVLDDGVDPASGAAFIVMELLEGETLAERLQRVKQLRPPVVAQIISQIARALGRGHEAGLIHRDLKPDNILIVRNDDEEVVKVLDFGIAKWLAAPQKLGSGTLANQVLGTPAYMSPEQITNSPKIDHRADLWSVGVIAFECMTGVRPFEAESLVSLAVRICSRDAPRPSSVATVPDGFDAWFARAVARDPRDRFPSARRMAEELRGLCGQMPMLWEPDATPPPQHSTREKTELEPVLELTRRVGGPRVVTDADSVMPMLRTASSPARRKGRYWLGALAVVVAAGAVASVTLSERLPSFQRVSSKLYELKTILRPDAPSAARGEAAPAPVVPTTTPSGTAPSTESSASPGAQAPGPIGSERAGAPASNAAANAVAPASIVAPRADAGSDAPDASPFPL